MINERHQIIVIASHNKGKVVELHRLLSELPYEIKNADEFNVIAPEESGSTFAENALIKARSVSRETGYISIADDSGLVVFALNGEPGVHSSRWCGPNKDFTIGINRIEQELKKKNTTDFSAKMVCALALCNSQGIEKVFVGEVFGKLTFPPRGNYGVGYESIFIPDGMNQTYGEISPFTKESINARAKAFEQLKNFLI